MTWFKVDDTLWGHPKWLNTSPRARALWVTSGSWCASQLQDGKVPRSVLPLLGGRPSDAAELVRAGLWIETQNGWSFHDWEAFQPTRDQVESKREYERERKRKYRRRPDGTYSGTTDGSPTNPSRPVPSHIPPTPYETTPPKRPDRSSATADGDEDQPNFDDFWNAYPRKDAKPRALSAWRRATRDTEPSDIVAALLDTRDALADVSDPRFVPQAATWLNDERWRDTAPEKPRTDPDSPWRPELYLPPAPPPEQKDEHA